MVRAIRPGGVLFLAFTNWLSPFGGHETSPWHFFGGSAARAERYERKHGEVPKNRYGSSLFRLDISDVLPWVRNRDDADLLDAFPRYYPRWTKPLVSVPGVREVRDLEPRSRAPTAMTIFTREAVTPDVSSDEPPGLNGQNGHQDPPVRERRSFGDRFRRLRGQIDVGGEAPFGRRALVVVAVAFLIVTVAQAPGAGGVRQQAPAHPGSGLVLQVPPPPVEHQRLRRDGRARSRLLVADGCLLPGHAPPAHPGVAGSAHLAGRHLDRGLLGGRSAWPRRSGSASVGRVSWPAWCIARRPSSSPTCPRRGTCWPQHCFRGCSSHWWSARAEGLDVPGCRPIRCGHCAHGGRQRRRGPGHHPARHHLAAHSPAGPETAVTDALVGGVRGDGVLLVAGAAGLHRGLRLQLPALHGDLDPHHQHDLGGRGGPRVLVLDQLLQHRWAALARSLVAGVGAGRDRRLGHGGRRRHGRTVPTHP